MLSKEENELLTNTDPGTPCGELMRRYWLPAALSEECPLGSDPLPVRLLGEDFVLWRDDQGRPTLFDVHCAHRGADLSYGRREDGGLRCLYHGWLYDSSGQCLDQPGEPLGSDFCAKVQQPAFPVIERAGVLFAYLGPGEPPLLPNYDFLTAPAERRFVSKYFQDCNYLQGSEGNIDPIHNNLLHHPNVNLAHTGVEDLKKFKGGRGPVPGVQRLDCAVTRFGLELCDITPVSPGVENFRTYNFVLPSLTTFPGQLAGKEGYQVNWHVPIDRTRHWKYTFGFQRYRPMDGSMQEERLGAGVEDGYRLKQNKSNRYGQNRAMLDRSYTGIDGFAAQDTWAIEGMGPVYDRSKEHLGASDKVIVAARRLLLRSIQDIEEGIDPPNVLRDPAENDFPDLVVWAETVPSGTDWQAFRREIPRRLADVAAQRKAAQPSQATV